MSADAVDNAVEFPPFRVPADWYAAAAPRATLVLIPALGTAAGYYRPIAEALAQRGIQVLVPELPGTGSSRPRPSRSADYGYRDLVARYLPGLVSLARKRGGGRPLVLAGHSLGAQVAALGLLHGYAAPDAILSIAGGLIHYRYWDGGAAAGVWSVAGLVTLLCLVFGYLPGRIVGFGGPQAKTLMRQWARTIRRGQFPDLGSGGLAASAIPALSIFYAGDAYAPRRSAAALAGRLNGDLQCLEKAGPGNPHATWARHPDSTVTCIEQWLTASGIVRAAGA